MSTGGLRYQYARLSIAEKLIVINLGVFIINGLVPFLFNLPADSIERWFSLPKDFFDFILKPWSILSYSFFHGGFFHLFWNMLILYMMSRIFLNLFNGRRFLNVYFLGAIFGGLVFLLGYNIFPAVIGVNAILIGASASVMAIVLFVATYTPNSQIRLVFFNIKLWHFAAFFVLSDLIQIPTDGNVGGHFAHLGGALLGYVYARQLGKGRDIGEGFSKFMDGVLNLFKKKEKKAPLKTVYRNQKTTKVRMSKDYDKESHQRKVDIILDKISKSGYESLSKAEKDFLFKAGKEN